MQNKTRVRPTNSGKIFGLLNILNILFSFFFNCRCCEWRTISSSIRGCSGLKGKDFLENIFLILYL